jgi:hypothetical protein
MLNDSITATTIRATGEYDMFDGPISGYAKVVNGMIMGEFVIEGG